MNFLLFNFPLSLSFFLAVHLIIIVDFCNQRLLKYDFEANRVTLAITSSFLECSGAKLVLRLEERKYYFWSQVSSAIVATAIFSEIPRELVPVFVEDNFPRPDIPITQKYRISVGKRIGQ